MIQYTAKKDRRFLELLGINLIIFLDYSSIVRMLLTVIEIKNDKIFIQDIRLFH